MSLKKSLLETFKGMSFSLSDAYEKFSSHYPKEQIRARIYESLGIAFKRIGRGVYFANSEAESVALIEGDGRDLSILKDQIKVAIVLLLIMRRSDIPLKISRKRPGSLKTVVFLLNFCLQKMRATLTIFMRSRKWLKKRVFSIIQK